MKTDGLSDQQHLARFQRQKAGMAQNLLRWDVKDNRDPLAQVGTRPYLSIHDSGQDGVGQANSLSYLLERQALLIHFGI